MFRLRSTSVLLLPESHSSSSHQQEVSYSEASGVGGTDQCLTDNSVLDVAFVVDAVYVTQDSNTVRTAIPNFFEPWAMCRLIEARLITIISSGDDITGTWWAPSTLTYNADTSTLI